MKAFLVNIRLRVIKNICFFFLIAASRLFAIRFFSFLQLYINIETKQHLMNWGCRGAEAKRETENVTIVGSISTEGNIQYLMNYWTFSSPRFGKVINSAALISHVPPREFSEKWGTEVFLWKQSVLTLIS